MTIGEQLKLDLDGKGGRAMTFDQIGELKIRDVALMSRMSGLVDKGQAEELHCALWETLTKTVYKDRGFRAATICFALMSVAVTAIHELSEADVAGGDEKGESVH